MVPDRIQKIVRFEVATFKILLTYIRTREIRHVAYNYVDISKHRLSYLLRHIPY